MTVFPEVTPIKGIGWQGNSAAGAISAWTSRSAKYGAITGRSQPIVIRAGEQAGLVSGAETATAATAVPMSGWQAFYIGVDFSIEDATTITITVVDSSGTPIQNARVYIEKVSDRSMILNELTNVNGVVTTSFDFPGTNVPTLIRVRQSSTNPKFVPFETLETITTSGMTATCVLIQDTITT
jgi:hypothetical protein